MAEMHPPTDWTEELLVRAAMTIDYPPTPDISAAVRLRLAAGAPARAVPGRSGPATQWARPLGVGLAVVVVAFVVALSASSGAREAVAEFLGLRVKGEQIAILPTPAPDATATPFPSPVAIEQYATPVAASDLATEVGFEPARPADAGNLQATYVIDYDGLLVAVLQYERFDLWQVALDGGTFDKGIPFFQKGATVLQETSVNQQPAWWIAGGGHIMRFVGPDGTVVAGSERTVDRNTLVWHSATGMNYRMETDLSLAEAAAIAGTLP
ncbi:MAG: hypothetical protein WED87_07235 [Dehalococcoidia bacterium]